MTAKTSEILALELDKLGLDQLAANARNDEYHDYLSPHAMPSLMLEADLRIAREDCEDTERAAAIEAIRQRHLSGDFDASAEESDEWAASEDGQATFAEFLGGIKPGQ